MKANERRLIAILALLAAVCGGAILSQSLLRKQRDLERRTQALELKQMEATAMLAEADLWKARFDWLRSNQPAMTSDSQATQALLDEMQNAAAKHNLVVQKKQLHEAAHQSFYNEVGVTLVMEGDLPDFFRWLHGMLSPESFRMVSLLKIAPDAQDKAKIIFTVRLNRRHSTALTAVDDIQPKEGGWLMSMTRVFAIACLAAAGAVSALAQEPAVFTPPQAYPVDRYEAAWSKNPFTLKTAPAVVENISFAKDLAIVSHYGDKANPTIVVVNTKTHERTRLKQGETATNGMKLISFKLGATRKETTVEVVLGSETTELKYNPEYMSQMAASGGGAAKPVPGMPMPVNPNQRPGAVPGMNPGMQQRPMPNGAPKIPLPTGAPAGRPAGVSSNMQQQQRGGMGGGNNFNASVTPSADGTNINLSLNPGNQGQIPGPLVSDVNPNAPPVPVRRRLISAPTNDQVLPQ